MKKLLALLLCAVMLLQIAPVYARAETDPEPPETIEAGVGIALTDPMEEVPPEAGPNMESEPFAVEDPDGKLMDGEEEAEESSPAVPGSGYPEFRSEYVEVEPDRFTERYYVYVDWYDEDWNSLDEETLGGQCQYLFFYHPEGIGYGSMYEAVPVGLTSQEWSGNGYIFDYSYYNNTEGALEFFADETRRTLTDPLWRDDPFVPEFTSDDIDISQYESSGGDYPIYGGALMDDSDNPFFAYLGALVRWRADEDSDWSFYCFTEFLSYFSIMPGEDYVPEFTVGCTDNVTVADYYTAADDYAYLEVNAQYYGGEIAYQWYKTETGSYDGEPIEGETGNALRAAYPTESGTEYYYCEVTYTYRDLEPGHWRSPVYAVTRTGAQGFNATLCRFSIYQSEITGTYPARDVRNERPVYIYNTNYALRAAVGDEATVSAYLSARYYMSPYYTYTPVFTHCDYLSYEWYLSDSEEEPGVLFDSGVLSGLTDYASMSDLNQAVALHCNPPTDQAGEFWLTFVGTVHYGEEEFTYTTGNSFTVVEDPCDLFSYNEETGKLSSYSGCSDVVVVPAEYHGMPVKSIDLNLGATLYTTARTGYRKVILPEGLEKIEPSCFYKVCSLEECNIPGTVTEIGPNAFYFTELREVRFSPDTFPEIGTNAFYGNRYLTAVVLPRNASGYLNGTKTFASCPELRTVTNYSSVLSPNPDDDFSGTPVLPKLKRSAQDDGTLLYTLNSAGTAYIVIGMLNDDAEVVIPDTFNDLPVVIVEASAFEEKDCLVRLTVGANVTEIQRYAFNNCVNLESVTLPAGLQYIRECAFYGCLSLRSVNLPEGLKLIGDRAFYNAISLERLAIPSTVSTIGNYAFMNMESATEVDFSQASSLRFIGEGAFAFALRNTSPVILNPDTQVGEFAFYFNTSVTSVTVDGCSLENAAFNWCTSLDEINGEWNIVYAAADEGDLVYYDQFLFARCYKVTTGSTLYRRTEDGYVLADEVLYNNRVTYYRQGDVAYVKNEETGKYYGAYYLDILATDLYIPGVIERDGYEITVTGLEHSMFSEMRTDRLNVVVGEGIKEIQCYGYRKIASFQFPSTAESFTSSLFYYCGGRVDYGSPYLTEIYLPASLREIPENAFAYCENLKTVTFDPQWDATPLADKMFMNCTGLEEITLPANTDLIPNRCFNGCKSLKTVHLPLNLKAIGPYAFAGCASLREIALPASFARFDLTVHATGGDPIEVQSSNAFAASGLTRIDLTGCPLLTELPEAVFYNTLSLTEILLGDGIRVIGADAFARGARTDSDPVSSIRWPANLRTIGDGAFQDCFLKDPESEPFLLELPDTVTSIGDSAFAGAGYYETGGFLTYEINVISLPDGKLPSALKTLGDNAFRKTALTKVVVPEGVTRIGSYAFQESSALTEAVLPDALEEIGDWAFADTGLTAPGGKYTLPAGLKRIGFAAFTGIPGVQHWVLPAGIEHLDRRAFAFTNDGKPHTLTILNQDGAMPVIEMDADFCQVPVIVRCYANSAACAWASGLQSGENGENLTLRLIDDSDMLRLLLLKRDGTAVGATELVSVLWYDATANDGRILSTETSLEGGFDPTHEYRVDFVTTDDLRYDYLVPETLSLSVFPDAETNVTYVLTPRERVTYVFSIADFNAYMYDTSNKLTVNTSVGDIIRAYDKTSEALIYDWDTHTYTLEVPRIETSLTVSRPDHITLRMKHIQMNEAVDGVIDLGELALAPNPLAMKYSLRYADVDSGKPVLPDFNGTFSLLNKTTGEDIPGIQVYGDMLSLPDNAYELITAGDELELSYSAPDNSGYALAEPCIFTAANGEDGIPVLSLRVSSPASCYIQANGSYWTTRIALFSAEGGLVSSGTGSVTVTNLAAGTYTLLIWNSTVLRSIPSPGFFTDNDISEEYCISETLTLSSGQRYVGEFDSPVELTGAILMGDLTLSLTADRARLSDSMIPVYLTFSAAGSAAGKEKSFTIQEVSGVSGRFVEYGGAYAYMDGEGVSATVYPGGGHTRPRMVITTGADEGTITIYCRAEGQSLTVSELSIGGISIAGNSAYVTLPVCTYDFTAPASVTGKDSGSLQVTYNSTSSAKALVFTDGALTGVVALPARGVTASAALPYSFETGGSSGIHTLQAVIVKNSFAGTPDAWYELVFSDDGSYDETVIASSPEYRITCLREAVPEPLKLVITGTNGEDSGWDGVKPVETAVVDFVNKTADRLKFVVTYWNLNDDGTIIKDYTLDYALTMDHPELITPGSVYLDVYCNENAEDPTVWTVPLARNPITGDYEGTLTFPGGTITANDMPYYVYVGYGYTPSESAVALDEAYLTQLADTAADDLQAIFDAAREENDLYDMDVDLDMVELLLETDLAELPAEHKQLIREVTVNMKELAEIHRETMLGVAADTSALQLLLSDGLTTGTCDGLDEAALLGMGAKKLETKNGTMFSLVGDETAILYDPANNVSVRVDAGALNEALSGADPALMSEDVLASLSAAAAYDAALMEEDKDYVAMANELAVLRNRILAVLDLVESVIDHFAAPTLQEMAALDNQAALTKEKYEEVLKDTLKAMKDPTTSNQMYQELSRDLARYDKVAREAKAAANEAKLLTRFKIFGYIKGALTGLRSGLLSNSTNISFALQTQKTLTELRNGVKSTSTLSSTIKNIFRAGGVVLGLLGIAIDVCSVVSAYGDLQNSFERYKNVDRLIDKGQKRLGWAFYEMYYLQLREDVLQKHGMTAQQQYDKGMAVWHKMTQDNIEVYSNRLTDFKMCYICGTCVNILGMLSALTGNAAVVAGIVSGGTLAQAQWGVTGAITLMMAESELDEDWEDYYEHVVGPVGSKKDDNDDDDSDEGDGSRRSGNTNSGSSRGGQGAHTPTAPQIDPAGYVYEAVASNRLSGVTVKASYLKDGEEVYWDDADFYDEVNPQITDETGTFSWYTPMGKWKVRAEKEGYAPADSENDPAAVDGWLPVPPPQMDVYIPMISRAAPTVESILAAPTEIRITFSKYMQAAQLAEDPGLVSAAMDGEAVETVFRFADLEESPALPGVFYGRTLVLTPADGGRFGGENVQASIGGGFMSYAGTAMGADYASGTVKIQPLAAEIRILRSGTLSTDVGTRRTVCVQVLDTEGNPMKDAAVSADSSTGKLQVSGTDAVTDASGMASVTVNGLSSGPDTLTFSAGIAEAELSARVSLENQVSPASSALVEARNVASGEAGVQLTAVVVNDTDLPTVGTLIAAVYLDGRFLASSLLPGLTVLPGDSAEAPMEVLCHDSGDVTVKVFYVAADSMVPLAANAN